MILQQCNKLVVNNGNNPSFSKKTRGKEVHFFNNRNPPIVREAWERLSAAEKVLFFFYAVTLNTFRMQTEVCLLINSFIFMQETDKDEIK